MTEEKWKKEIRNIVEQRQLTSYMNDTKWNELRTAMLEEMPFPPSYFVKSLFREKVPEYWENVWYWGDWRTGLSDVGDVKGYWIEWLEIYPQYKKHIGMLVEPQIIDASQELEVVLAKYHIPYEKIGHAYRIYGYK